jgi:hypothetical protein
MLMLILFYILSLIIINLLFIIYMNFSKQKQIDTGIIEQSKLILQSFFLLSPENLFLPPNDNNYNSDNSVSAIQKLTLSFPELS